MYMCVRVHVSVYVGQRTTSGVIPRPLLHLFVTGSHTDLEFHYLASLSKLGYLARKCLTIGPSPCIVCFF